MQIKIECSNLTYKRRNADNYFIPCPAQQLPVGHKSLGYKIVRQNAKKFIKRETFRKENQAIIH